MRKSSRGLKLDMTIRQSGLYGCRANYLSPDKNTILYFTRHIRLSIFPASEADSGVISPFKKAF